jgi:hypothetical protein
MVLGMRVESARSPSESALHNPLSAAMALGFALVAFAVGIVAQPQHGAPWSMFMGNPRHTGQSLSKGPGSTPVARWTFKVDTVWPASAAIGSDGTV